MNSELQIDFVQIIYLDDVYGCNEVKWKLLLIDKTASV